MAQKGTTATVGSTEEIKVMSLTELIIEALKDALSAEEIKKVTDLVTDDYLVFALPDTGKAKFVGSHVIKTGKQAGKDSKATFVVAELGSNFAGEDTGYHQTVGDHQGLSLLAKISIIAQPPNTAGKTLDEALNRKVELKEAPRTGTDN